ncbi:hypothetical protein FH608_034090 [Nonomuraea phyllanthi]|uniref:Uncharacterized protein n=1 Tax=Nonomuraea phyllanthi TaxID=2219224 RepID=A0A5C4VXZ2_9ACTN|nr:hypothetical protein FH608_034090 [Nonomuraea phyllanthi]
MVAELSSSGSSSPGCCTTACGTTTGSGAGGTGTGAGAGTGTGAAGAGSGLGARLCTTPYAMPRPSTRQSSPPPIAPCQLRLRSASGTDGGTMSVEVMKVFAGAPSAVCQSDSSVATRLRAAMSTAVARSGESLSTRT